MRKQPPKVRASSALSTSMLLNLFELGDSVKNIPEDEKIPPELVGEFLRIFVPFSQSINSMTAQLNEIRDRLIQEMKIQGFDTSVLLLKKVN